jgi:hypothetical protein
MAQLKARPGPGQKKRIAKRVSEIPNDQLACRAGRHLWPFDQLQAGKAIPRGLTVEPLPEARGVYEVRDVCPRCGKTRWMLTLPDSSIDPGANWSYVDPKDWVTLDRDLEVTKRDLRTANFALNSERLLRG